MNQERNVHRRFDGADEKWERNIERELEELQSWRTQHMNDCHPGLLKQQSKMEGRWAIIAGFCFGVGIALGYIAGAVINSWIAS